MANVWTPGGWYEAGDPRLTQAAGPNGTQASLMTQGGTAGYNGLMAGFPELEAAANRTSGYESIWGDKEYGKVPQADMDAYWSQATDNAMDKSRGAYASVFGERGMAPSGVGGQAEMLSRRGRELSEARAGANVENAAQGARAQAQARSSISGNRYKVLTDPVEAYYRLQQGLGTQQPTTNSQTIARPSVPGGREYASGGPGVSQRPQRDAPGAPPSSAPSSGGVQLPGYGGKEGYATPVGIQANPVSPAYGPEEYGTPTAAVEEWGQTPATPYGQIYEPRDGRTPDTYAW
jgi:hypothetical protein